MANPSPLPLPDDRLLECPTLRANRARGDRARAGLLVLLFLCVTAAFACTEADHGAGSNVATNASEVRDCATHIVRMGVAASLRDIADRVVGELAEQTPPIRAQASWGASSALARQLELGAPFDLIVSADAEITDALAGAGRLAPASQRTIAEGRLVLAARRDAPFSGRGIAVFDDPALRRFALPAQAVPLGRYGEAWLRRIGQFEKLDGRRVITENARATAVALEQGHVDLALLYESDFRLTRNLERMHRPDPNDYPRIRYVAARTTRAPACAEIDRALAAWSAPKLTDHLVAAGFDTPEGA